MRELKVVGLDVDGKRIICETDDSGEKFLLRSDDRLRAAVRGEKTAVSPPQSDTEVPNVLRPKEIQAKIRAGASVEQVASAAGAGTATAGGAVDLAASQAVGGDVVETVVKDEHDKLGRNDPCWCGSGKKYKKCHGQ